MRQASRIYIYLALLLSSSAGAQSTPIELSVNVSGGKANVGQAILSVFGSSNEYLKQPLIEQRARIDQNGAAVFAITFDSPGTYAVSVVYDEDNSGDLKAGLFGIPKEPVGFPNNARGRFGPPPFSKTSFELHADKAIDIELLRVKK